MKRIMSTASCALVIAASGCIMDTLGYQETVTQTSQLFQPPAIEDDKISDKHPVFDAGKTVTEQIDSCVYSINKSGSITKLDLPGFSPSDAALKDKLFPTYAAAAAALEGRDRIPSMEVVEAALKPFDDGLYAAVERGAEHGSSGSPVTKQALFRAILAQLVTNATTAPAAEQGYAREAAGYMAAAMKLGGDAPSAPGDVLGAADTLIAGFSADPLASKPIGFYTWSSDLTRVFQRDRFLQGWPIPGATPSFGALAATAHAIDETGKLADYGKVLDLYAGMTDAYFHRPVGDLLPQASAAGAFGDVGALQRAFLAAHPEGARTPAACAARLAVLPPSESPDERVMREQFCAQPPPPGTNLLDVLVNLIRAGQVDLTPRAGSGWASQQVWALATLLAPETAPEKDHLFLTAAYKKKLIETFKTILVENRETQAKQDEIGVSEGVSYVAPPVDVYPALLVEPFPTYYLRTARGYRFVQALLTSVMGTAFLAQSHRVIEDGTASVKPLGQELSDVVTRTYGLYALAADAIGFTPLLAPGEDDGVDLDAARAAARTWLQGWTSDADIARDPRVIVPEFVDADAGTVHYWAMVGVRALPMRASFYPGFEPKLLAQACTTGKFVSHDFTLLVGKTIDVAVPRTKPPPTRDEFRKICDANGSADAIAAALQQP